MIQSSLNPLVDQNSPIGDFSSGENKRISKNDDLICNICFNTLPAPGTHSFTLESRTIVCCPNDHDKYHEACLRTWLGSAFNQRSCPECRTGICNSQDYIKKGTDVSIGDHASNRGPLTIGDNTRIGENLFINGPVMIEENVSIGHGVKINAYTIQKVIIAKRSSLGDNVSIKGNVIIEEGATIGSNALIDAGQFGGKIMIGRGASLGDHVQIYANSSLITSIGEECILANEVKIDGFVVIKSNVLIGNNSSITSSIVTRRRPTGENKIGTLIEEGTTIGSNVKIDGPVTIKSHASIENETEIRALSFIGPRTHIQSKVVLPYAANEDGTSVSRFGIKALQRFLGKISRAPYTHSNRQLNKLEEDWTEL